MRRATTVTVLLFATAREAVGRPSLRFALGGERSLSALLARIADRYPPLRPVLRHSRVARNGRYVSGGSVRLNGGDEIAIHPPYSGG